jgi:hypothetical protein
MLRDINGLSIKETASRLSLTRGVVKTRPHRARAWLRRRLETVARAHASDFDGYRCDRLTSAVMSQVAARIACRASLHGTRTAQSAANSRHEMPDRGVSRAVAARTDGVRMNFTTGREFSAARIRLST